MPGMPRSMCYYVSHKLFSCCLGQGDYSSSNHNPPTASHHCLDGSEQPYPRKRCNICCPTPPLGRRLSRIRHSSSRGRPANDFRSRRSSPNSGSSRTSSSRTLSYDGSSERSAEERISRRSRSDLEVRVGRGEGCSLRNSGEQGEEGENHCEDLTDAANSTYCHSSWGVGSETPWRVRVSPHGRVRIGLDEGFDADMTVRRGTISVCGRRQSNAGSSR